MASQPRLKRLRREDHHYKKHRKALSTLLRESENRCGYSLIHVFLIGETSMEVDHYDPRNRGLRRNFHGNLIAASRECNGKKQDFWPSTEQRRDGKYILNPYRERDYGKHLILDPKSGKLVGVTKTGRWQIVRLGLNSERLCRLRRYTVGFKKRATEAASIASLDKTDRAFDLLMQEVGELKELGVLFPEIPTSVVEGD